MKHSTVNKIAYISIALTLSLLAGVLVLLLKPYNINEIVEPAIIKTPIVEAGHEVQFEVEFCKKQDLTATISRLLVSTNEEFSARIPLIQFTDNAPPKCNKFDVFEKIPEFVEAGEYVVFTSIKYVPNAIRGEVEYTFNTEPFDIINLNQK